MKLEGFTNQLYNFVWPKLSYIKLKLKLLKPVNRACLKSIKQQINSNAFDTELSKINFIRNWVNTNSVHLIDQEHDSYAFNVPEVLNRLNTYSLGGPAKKCSKPHLSCGPRAYAMKAILDFMSIRSRIIDLFGLSELGDGCLKVSPHTLIEVLEADTKKWVLHDPDFNIAYANINTKKYQSAEEMLGLKKEDKGYQAAGYKIENLLNLQNTVAGLFEWAVLYRYSYEGARSELAIVKGQELLMYIVENNGTNLLSFVKERAYQLRLRLLER